jgi:hypothetical protein
MSETLDGIHEKLKRADESIQNLQSEISAFFKGCEYPPLRNMGDENMLQAIQYHRNLKIPTRFKVLAGEIVHHLRSCLDHIAWELSTDTYRLSPKTGKFVEFPIMETRPTRESVFTRYTRKIKGIPDLQVRKRIVSVQPYRNGGGNDPLAIIHRIDVTDKHRELVMINNIGTVSLPEPLAAEFRTYLSGTTKLVSARFKTEFNKYGPVTPQVVFREFGDRKRQPVIPSLAQLVAHTKYVVLLFRDKL